MASESPIHCVVDICKYLCGDVIEYVSDDPVVAMVLGGFQRNTLLDNSANVILYGDNIHGRNFPPEYIFGLLSRCCFHARTETFILAKQQFEELKLN